MNMNLNDPPDHVIHLSDMLASSRALKWLALVLTAEIVMFAIWMVLWIFREWPGMFDSGLSRGANLVSEVVAVAFLVVVVHAMMKSVGVVIVDLTRSEVCALLTFVAAQFAYTVDALYNHLPNMIQLVVGTSLWNLTMIIALMVGAWGVYRLARHVFRRFRRKGDEVTLRSLFAAWMAWFSYRFIRLAFGQYLLSRMNAEQSVRDSMEIARLEKWDQWLGVLHYVLPIVMIWSLVVLLDLRGRMVRFIEGRSENEA